MVIRRNGKPGVFEVESWFGILVAALTVLAVGFGIVRGMILDSARLKNTEIRSMECAVEVDTLSKKVDKIEVILPRIENDVKEVKDDVKEVKSILLRR